jgi:hypothetical protein
LTPSRPETETAGSETYRTGTGRNKMAAQVAKALVEQRVRFPAAPQEKAGQGQKPWPAFFFINISSTSVV